MKDRVFLDTNIFVYTQSAIEPRKRAICLRIIDQYDCFVSTQVLNEISNVMLKKLKMGTGDVKQIVAAVNDNCNVNIVNYDTVQKSLNLNEKYGYTYYDSLILASALESGCQRVFTEDMQDGQVIDNRLTIINPFEENAV